jgi:hypothetical protein
VSKIIHFRDIPYNQSYERFSDMKNIRDAIMHPSESNAYNVDWAKVPISWISSNKCIASCENCRTVLVYYYVL